MLIYHLTMFFLSLTGMSLIMLSMQKQKRLFVQHLPSLNDDKFCLKIRYGGFTLLAIALWVSFISPLVGFFLTAWFGWLSFSAGLVAILVYQQRRVNQK